MLVLFFTVLYLVSTWYILVLLVGLINTIDLLCKRDKYNHLIYLFSFLPDGGEPFSVTACSNVTIA